MQRYISLLSKAKYQISKKKKERSVIRLLENSITWTKESTEYFQCDCHKPITRYFTNTLAGEPSATSFHYSPLPSQAFLDPPQLLLGRRIRPWSRWIQTRRNWSRAARFTGGSELIQAGRIWEEPRAVCTGSRGFRLPADEVWINQS